MEASENVRLHIKLSDHPVEVQTGFQGNGHGEGREEEGWCKVASVSEDARYTLFLAYDITPLVGNTALVVCYRFCTSGQNKKSGASILPPPPPPPNSYWYILYILMD